jgi:HEPN domain-containing protein
MANRWRDWWSQAERDLDHARESASAGRHEWACFAAHQSAEKAVKALHLRLGQEAWGHVNTALPQALTQLPDFRTHFDNAVAAFAFELGRGTYETVVKDAPDKNEALNGAFKQFFFGRLITLHPDLDALLPIDTASDPYAEKVRGHGHGDRFRYYVVEGGTHVDPLTEELETFDREVESLGDRLAPVVELELIGPLPPFSFAGTGGT